MMRLMARLPLHLFVHPVACLVFQLIVPDVTARVPGKAARMGGAAGGVMVCKVVRFCHGHASCLSVVSCCGAS